MSSVGEGGWGGSKVGQRGKIGACMKTHMVLFEDIAQIYNMCVVNLGIG